ncbi:MAG: type II toxin-antitoxin system prevent-host-death family antitoxin [Gemmatimonadota bacterium]
MEQIGAYKAKTHLAELLDRVEAGEALTITRHGRPIARLSPSRSPGDPSVSDVAIALRAFRDAHPLGDSLTIKQLIREGRRS